MKELRSKFERIIQDVKNHTEQIAHLERASSPVGMANHIQFLAQKITDMSTRVSEIDNKIENLISDKYLAEEISNDELYQLWKTSGVTLKAICEKFAVEIPTASTWVNGKVENKTIRANLKRFMVERAKQNATI